MAKKIKFGRLYGVIAPILPDGEFVKCEPVFVNTRNPQNPSDYYLGVKKIHKTSILSEEVGISHFERIDITTYGKKVFLPASRNKINDGKQYFIAFQPSKNCTKACLRNYYICPEIAAGQDEYYSHILNVGILFPNKFVALIATEELSEEYLQSAIQ